jgi:hypothetical protein
MTSRIMGGTLARSQNLITDAPPKRKRETSTSPNPLRNVAPSLRKGLNRLVVEILKSQPTDAFPSRRPERDGGRFPDVILPKARNKTWRLGDASPSKRAQLNDKKSNHVGEYVDLEPLVTSSIDCEVVACVPAMKSFPVKQGKPDLNSPRNRKARGKSLSVGMRKEGMGALREGEINNNGGLKRKRSDCGDTKGKQ